jgi:hypothetical protein
MEKNEQIDGLKKTLAATVERKQQNTRERVAYKKAHPVSDERSMMLRSYWSTNSDLKEEIRSLGLAYAFLRGRRYWVTERTTKHPPVAAIVAGALGGPSFTEAVQAWLDESPTPEEKLAFEQHLAVATAKAREENRARSAAAAARRAA